MKNLESRITIPLVTRVQTHFSQLPRQFTAASVQSLAPSIVGGLILAVFFFEAGLPDAFSQRGAFSAFAIALGVTLLRGTSVHRLRAVQFLEQALGPLIVFLSYPKAGTFLFCFLLFLIQLIQSFEHTSSSSSDTRTALFSDLGLPLSTVQSTVKHMPALALSLCFIVTALAAFAANFAPEAAHILKGVPFAAFAVAIVSMITSTHPSRIGKRNGKEFVA